MKLIKVFGLTAITVLMAMVLFGSSQAMAEYTSLCNVDEGEGAHEVCPAGHRYVHEHEETLAVKPAVILSALGNISCNELFLGEVPLNANNEPIDLGRPLKYIGNFAYAGCVRGTENCTVVEQNGPATVEFLKEGAETASVTGKWEIKVKCGFFVNCTYDAEGLVGTAHGPLLSAEENGGLLLDEQVMHKVAGALCPTQAKLDITTQWRFKAWIEE
jgi:hypothetical protein